jgi:hypothetical protein
MLPPNPQANGKVTVTLKGVATVLRVLQEKLSVMPEGAASALKQIHSQVCVHCCREAPDGL